MRSFLPLPTPARLAAGLVAAALVLAPVPSRASHPQVLSIAAARALPLGSTVTVEGSVTVPSGVFASSFFDEGFAIQDHTGGIYVSMADNLGLHLRQEARVTGTLADSGGLLILVPAADSDVQVRGHGREVEPRRVPTGSIGEATEGRLVRVVGTIDQPVVDDLPFGYKIFVNDGSGEIRIFINLETNIDVSGFEQGQRVSVTGFSGQFEDYEIDPRFPSDIRVEGNGSHAPATAIGVARRLPLGSTVTVEGSVTVPSGIFSSGGSLDQGFAIEDRTGGIYVSIATNLGLTLGQQVRVTGQLADSNGELILVPAGTSDVDVLGRGRRVEPLRLRTGHLGAANQGLLVRITGTITGALAPDPPFGTQFFVDDGSGPARIFVNTSTGIDLSHLAAGQRVSVTGLSSAFDTPEIDPRFQSDIRVEGHH